MTSATNSESGGSAAPWTSGPQRWTLTSLIRRHRIVAAVSLAVVAVAVAVTILTTLANPQRQSLTDAATCSQWAGATPAQQTSYAHLYINEYGRFANTAARAAAVRAEIVKACVHASYLGEADDVSVLAALRHAF